MAKELHTPAAARWQVQSARRRGARRFPLRATFLFPPAGACRPRAPRSRRRPPRRPGLGRWQLDRRCPRHPAQGFARPPARPVCHQVRRHRPEDHPPSRRCRPTRTPRLRGRALRGGFQESAQAPDRAQWRYFCGREQPGSHPCPARRRRQRSARDQRGLRRRRHEETLRCRLLPARAGATVSLRRQHRFRRALPLPQRRLKSLRPGGKPRRESVERRPADRRRALDARPRLLARRQADVRVHRLEVQRRREQQPRGGTTRAHLRVSPRRHRPKGLCLGHPQRRRHRRAPRHRRRTLDEHQRARRPRRRPRARLHLPRHGGRVLRLALVHPGQPSGPPQDRRTPRTRAENPHARRARAVFL